MRLDPQSSLALYKVNLQFYFRLCDLLRENGLRWAAAGREGQPQVQVLIAMKPTPEQLEEWAAAGATDLIWGVPDKSTDEVLAYLDRLAGRIGLDASTAGAPA